MPNIPTGPINTIGTQPIPNDTAYRGIINNGYVTGVTSTSWNGRSGGLSKIVFKGTQAQLTPVAQKAKNAGYEYSLVGGHVWTLEVTFPFDVILDASTGESPPLFTWEIINSPFEKDILELGDRPFNSNLSADTIRAIEQKIKNPDNGQPPYTLIDANNGFAALNAQIAYVLKSVGIHGRQSSLQTLRRTMIVGNAYNYSSAILPQYDYRLFTTPALGQTYNNNSNPLNQIPTAMAAALPNTMNVSRWNGSGTALADVSGWNMDGKGIITYIGWLQFPAEYQMVSVNKVQITQNWTFNQWSAGSYGLYDVGLGSDSTFNPDDIYHIIS